MIYGLVIAAPCCLAEWLNNLSHGGLLRWANEGLISYWHFLNAVCSLVGWRYGFGPFWNYRPLLAAAVFLAIPIIGGIATCLVLKRERLATSIILFLYAWHYGLSTFIHTPTQWMVLLTAISVTGSFIFGFRLVRLLRNAFREHVKRNGFNNVRDGIRKSFFNDSHGINEDILHKQVF